MKKLNPLGAHPLVKLKNTELYERVWGVKFGGCMRTASSFCLVNIFLMRNALEMFYYRHKNRKPCFVSGVWTETLSFKISSENCLVFR